MPFIPIETLLLTLSQNSLFLFLFPSRGRSCCDPHGAFGCTPCALQFRRHRLSLRHSKCSRGTTRFVTRFVH